VIRAVAAYAAPSDMARWAASTEYPGIPKHVARHCPTPEACAARSPEAHAGEIRCPVLLVHGAADARVPPAESERLFEAINAAGGQAHLALVPGAEHMFDDETHGRVWGQVVAFYREALPRANPDAGDGA
jgi:dipeptidyl aminopeptidase/acylaminoacyl peptidase